MSKPILSQAGRLAVTAEPAVPDRAWEEAVVTAVGHAAHTGLLGDGKIYVLPARAATVGPFGRR